MGLEPVIASLPARGWPRCDVARRKPDPRVLVRPTGERTRERAPNGDDQQSPDDGQLNGTSWLAERCRAAGQPTGHNEIAARFSIELGYPSGCPAIQRLRRLTRLRRAGCRQRSGPTSTAWLCQD